LIDGIESVTTVINKINFTDFNLPPKARRTGFLNSLTQVELLAFPPKARRTGLLLNQIILNYTFTIILILYGDYLIKRFNLENKYSKFAKIIQLRQKLQSYYLKLAFVWIFLAVLFTQMFVYLSIILPKLLSIFN